MQCFIPSLSSREYWLVLYRCCIGWWFGSRFVIGSRLVFGSNCSVPGLHSLQCVIAAQSVVFVVHRYRRRYFVCFQLLADGGHLQIMDKVGFV